MMDKRPLGRSGIAIAPLMFGGNVFGWTVDEATSFALLDRFVDAGFNAIDTANVYSRWVPGHEGGESETVIGAWLRRRGRSDDVVIATKLGMEMPDGQGLSADYMVRAVEQSLKRLGRDHIDLYQAHRDDRDTPLDETLEAFDRLVASGKVRAIGASNYNGDRLTAALGTSEARGSPRYETLQPLYNLYDRTAYEADLEPVARASGIGVIPYYGLAAGFLTGKYRSEADLAKSPRGRGVGAKYLNERGLRIVGALDIVAGELSATPAQVALAWLMAQPTVTAPIASATSVEQLDDLVGAARLMLNADQMAKLDAASA
jgi:aryl-alcohol dehydrogenase-like predicted oxidoreductase